MAGSSSGSKRCRAAAAAAAVIGNAVFASCVAAPVKAVVCAYKLVLLRHNQTSYPNKVDYSIPSYQKNLSYQYHSTTYNERR